MLQLVEPHKIPRLAEAKQVFESTEDIPGVKEGVVELVELSKIPMIVGSKHFLRRTDLITPGAEEGA
ncbi:hypothetical protein A2U01_0095366, partial [Trifolium medium]|nr:hypothetical protein [Trifolium medium]